MNKNIIAFCSIFIVLFLASCGDKFEKNASHKNVSSSSIANGKTLL